MVSAAREAVVLPRRSEGDLSEEDGAEPEAESSSRLPADPAMRAGPFNRELESYVKKVNCH